MLLVDVAVLFAVVFLTMSMVASLVQCQPAKERSDSQSPAFSPVHTA